MKKLLHILPMFLGGSENQMAVDPVCKMNVAEGQAKYTGMHGGTKYYFCSAACKQEFEKNPSKYV